MPICKNGDAVAGRWLEDPKQAIIEGRNPKAEFWPAEPNETIWGIYFDGKVEAVEGMKDVVMADIPNELLELTVPCHTVKVEDIIGIQTAVVSFNRTKD